MMTADRREILGLGAVVAAKPALANSQLMVAPADPTEAWTDAPPVILIHAIDDPSVPVENTITLLSALRRDGAIAEAQVFQEGGHGFGIRLIADRPAAAWPALALAFGRGHGWLTVTGN